MLRAFKLLGGGGGGTLSGNFNALNSDMSKVYGNPTSHFRRSYCFIFRNAPLQFWDSRSIGFGGRAFKGQWHTIEDAGINPLPTRRTIPIWFGGQRRCHVAADRENG